MPTVEKDSLVRYKDSEGNMVILYPITKADNVEGVHQLNQGGTGALTAAAALKNLIGGAEEKSTATLADMIPLLDATADTGKKISLNALATLFGGSTGLTVENMALVKE